MTQLLTPLFAFFIVLPWTHAEFNFPDNINFVTSIYNSTNCSTTAIQNKTLQYMCFKTNKINGYPECCYDVLNSVSIHNSSFNTCLSENLTQYNINGISYSCDLTNFKELTTEETFAYIGLILFIIIVIVLFGVCCNFCFFRTKITYNRI
jgi:hypothetical protein